MEQPSFKLMKPKKRKWVRWKKVSPFPVPISSISGLPAQTTKWCYFSGYLVDNYVTVMHTGDIDFLYRMGFFGKGHLSQNQPQCMRPSDGHRESSTDHNLRIIGRRKYLRHLAWQSGTNNDLLHIHPVKEHRKLDVFKEKDTETADLAFESLEFMTKDKRCKTVDDSPTTSDQSPHSETCVVGNSASEDGIDSVWPVNQGDDEDPWASTTVEESDQFWTTDDNCESISVKTESRTEFNDCSPGDGQKTCENRTTHQVNDCTTCGATSRGNGSQVLNVRESNEEIKIQNILGMNETEQKVIKCMSCARNDTFGQTLIDDAKGADRNCGHSVSDADCKSKSLINTEATTLFQSESAASVSTGGHSSQVAHVLEDTSESTDCKEGSKSGNETADPGTQRQCEETGVDPRCLSDHEDGDLFVVNDTDESEAEMESSEVTRSRLKWEPAMKRDPHQLKEELRLSLQEAFFLSYGLGCLVTLDENKKPLDLMELWSEFRRRQPGFLSKYIAYHNFRSKGWVPKPGLKFGVDWLVYCTGPPFTHATYAVLVIEVDSADARSEKSLNWSSLAGQHRVVKQAGKELMLCYVIKPNDLTEAELDSPKCIPRFTVQEVIVRRWMSKQERVNINCMEIP